MGLLSIATDIVKTFSGPWILFYKEYRLLCSVYSNGVLGNGDRQEGAENAGVENAAPDGSGGKRWSGKVWKAQSPRYLTLLQVCYNSH